MIPPINLPGRKPKEKKDEVKVNVSAIEGTMRRLGEKDLLLQTKSAVLKFRLISKTLFQNKNGEPMRDSLLHPGDQLSVFVSPDDPETALKVVQARPGTATERAGAEQTIAESQIRAPGPQDLGKSGTMTTRGGGGPISTDGVSVPPVDRDSRPAEDASPAPSGDVGPDASETRGNVNLMGDADIIRETRITASSFSSTLPDFVVLQATRRYYSAGFPPQWRPIDEVTAELVYLHGKEDYRNVKIDGQPAIRPPEDTGSWSTGEFGTTLEDVMSVTTNAAFRRRGEERVGSRDAIVYSYAVEQPNSHWTLVSPDGRRYNPAYDGSIWVDKQSLRVLKIQQRANSLPAQYPFTRAESTLTYGFARIESRTYLLPAAGENVSCMSGGSCTRNMIEFRDYRKFTTDSKVVF